MQLIMQFSVAAAAVLIRSEPQLKFQRLIEPLLRALTVAACRLQWMMQLVAELAEFNHDQSGDGFRSSEVRDAVGIVVPLSCLNTYPSAMFGSM
jgi:hypothetical protein